MSFSELPLFPKPLSWSTTAYSDTQNALVGIWNYGTTSSRSKVFDVPYCFAIVVVNSNNKCAAIMYFHASGCYNSTRGVVGAPNGTFWGYSKPGHILTPISGTDLRPNPLYEVGSLTKPLDEEDYKGQYDQYVSVRENNLIRLGIVDEQIDSVKKDILLLQSDTKRSKLASLKSQIGVLHSLVFPNSNVVVPTAQILELKNYKDDVIDIKPSLVKILGKDFPDLDKGLDELSKLLNDLQKQVDAVDPNAGYFRFLDSKWQLLIRDHTPSGVFSNVISKDTLEDIRGKLVQLDGTARDFTSELELVGYLVAAEKDAKNKLDAALTNYQKPDAFSELRSQLIQDVALLNSQISSFVCDVSALEIELKRKEKEGIKKKAAKDYTNNKGFKGKNVNHTKCPYSLRR